MKATEKLKIVLERIENTLGKEKMLVTSRVFLSHDVFKSLLSMTY